MENDGCVEKVHKYGRYPKKERRISRKRWKNHTLIIHGKKWANMAFLDDHLNFNEA